MKRWVNRGAKGIALIDDRYPKKRLRYVFDVSDTHKVQGGKTPYLWQLKEHQKEPLLEHLSEVYGLAGEDTVAFTSALWKIAQDMTEENLEEAMEGLEYEVEGTFLEDLDEQTIQTEFRELLQNSIFYSLSRRCGLDPMDVLEEGDFTAITDFRSMSVLTFLGNATNQIVEPILRDIGRTVWRMDWEEQKEKSQKRVENSSQTHYNEFNTLMQESEKMEEMRMELTYYRKGDYLFPNLTIENEPVNIGKYGMLRKTFLKENRKNWYQSMLLTGKLEKHLMEIEKAAQERMEVLMNGLLIQYPAPDKEEDQMKWVAHMNNLQQMAEESVLTELVYN